MTISSSSILFIERENKKSDERNAHIWFINKQKNLKTLKRDAQTKYK